jgi:hypothetical protein
MVPSPGLGFAKGDGYQQLPELGGAIDLEIAARRAAKECTKDRLDHVRAIYPGGHPGTQVLLGQLSQAAGIARKDHVRRRGFARGAVLNQWADRFRISHCAISRESKRVRFLQIDRE